MRKAIHEISLRELLRTPVGNGPNLETLLKAQARQILQGKKDALYKTMSVDITVTGEEVSLIVTVDADLYTGLSEG